MQNSRTFCGTPTHTTLTHPNPNLWQYLEKKQNRQNHTGIWYHSVSCPLLIIYKLTLVSTSFVIFPDISLRKGQFSDIFLTTAKFQVFTEKVVTQLIQWRRRAETCTGKARKVKRSDNYLDQARQNNVVWSHRKLRLVWRGKMYIYIGRQNSTQRKIWYEDVTGEVNIVVCTERMIGSRLKGEGNRRDN